MAGNLAAAGRSFGRPSRRAHTHTSLVVSKLIGPVRLDVGRSKVLLSFPIYFSHTSPIPTGGKLSPPKSRTKTG